MTSRPDDVAEAARHARRARQRDQQTSSRRAHDQLRTSIRVGLIADSVVIMEHALVRALSTSRNAVREALQLLADESLVERSPRTGTRICGSILEIPLDEVLPLQRSRPRADQQVTARVLEWRTVPATPTLASMLEVPLSEPLHMSEQLILVGGAPLAVQCVYSVESMRSEPIQAALTHDYEPDDLPTVLQQVFGPQVIGGDIHNQLQAVACEPRTAARLGLAVGAPMLSRELLFRNRAGQPYLFGYAHYRGDRVTIDASARMSENGHSRPAAPTAGLAQHSTIS